MRLKRIWIVVLMATLALSACGDSDDGDSGATAAGDGGADEGEAAEDQEVAKLTFLIPAGSVTQFHPWYIAEELGYFEEEGVEVEIVAGDGSSSIL